MDTNNFILEITDAVRQLLGSSYNVFSKKETRNNSVLLTALIIKCKEHDVSLSPMVYLEDFFHWYKAGIPIDLIAKEIIKIYREHEFPVQINLSPLADYEKTKSRIVFQLVNTERNAPLFKTIPHMEFLDFSIIFRIFLGRSPIGSSSITITNEILNLWNVDAATVYDAALANTPVLQEYSLKSIDAVATEVILGVSIDEDDVKPDEIYVLTNKQHTCGAGCILYPHVLEDFAEQTGSGFYILPSSVNDVVLVPEDIGDSDFLRQSVKEVNTRIAQEDFLSDNVYYYSRETNEITIIQ